MKRALAGITLALPLGLLSAVSVALAQQADAEHPYGNLRRLGAVHGLVKDTDASSFKKAVALYPYYPGRRTHRIAMGQYLMWKIITLYPTRVRFRRVWLHDFREVCRVRLQSIGPVGVRCSIRADLRIHSGNRIYRFWYSRPDVPVGAHFKPDDRNYRAVVFSSVRKPVDMAVEFMAQQMRRYKVLPPE